MNEVVYTVTKFLEARYFVCKQTQGNVETSQKKKTPLFENKGTMQSLFLPNLVFKLCDIRLNSNVSIVDFIT